MDGVASRWMTTTELVPLLPVMVERQRYQHLLALAVIPAEALFPLLLSLSWSRWFAVPRSPPSPRWEVTSVLARRSACRYVENRFGVIFDHSVTKAGISTCIGSMTDEGQ